MLDQFYFYFSLLLAYLTQLTGSLGGGIIIFTVALRMLLFPLTLSSLKAAGKMRLLQPELKKIQKKFKDSPKELQQAQMALYQENKINPLAGCLPQILQLVLLIILYRGLLHFFGLEQVAGITINPHFLWLNLSQADPYYVLPILAGLSQFGLSWLMMGTAKKSEPKKEEKKDPAEGSDMASMMQKQMLYIMPIFSAFIALRLPSGLVLYWVISTAVSAVQQLYANKLVAKEDLETSIPQVIQPRQKKNKSKQK
ncbi:membrane protein insertase YidC [Candidatus Woesebacteria bacterium]|nr:membrane protein insertase YidC [Candidatus Woesebacteria bacterium]